jgi:hypothetical protein
LSRYHSQCERRLHDNKTTSKQSLGLTTLDEIGATIGPLLIALVLLLNRSYQAGYALLVIPALLALASLVAVRIGFPLPARLEKGHAAQASGFTPSYWLYMLAGGGRPDELRTDLLPPLRPDRLAPLAPPAPMGLRGVWGGGGALLRRHDREERCMSKRV